MNKEQSINDLIGDIRNKLQPFWTLVDIIRIPAPVEIAQDKVKAIVLQADMAEQQEQAIITALESILEKSEQLKYTEEDIDNIIKASCNVVCRNSQILPDTIQNSKKEIYEWLQEYKKLKEKQL